MCVLLRGQFYLLEMREIIYLSQKVRLSKFSGGSFLNKLYIWGTERKKEKAHNIKIISESKFMKILLLGKSKKLLVKLKVVGGNKCGNYICNIKK